MSAEPTAEQLAAVLRHPNAYTAAPEGYEGGVPLKDALGRRTGLVHVQSDGGRVQIHPNVDLEGFRGFASFLLDLSPEESAEIRLAMEYAETAARRFRARRPE